MLYNKGTNKTENDIYKLRIFVITLGNYGFTMVYLTKHSTALFETLFTTKAVGYHSGMSRLLSQGYAEIKMVL